VQLSGSGLSRSELFSLYDYRQIIELRLARLLSKGQVVARDGRYFLNGFLLWSIAVVVRSAKLLVMGKGSEFEGAEAGPLAGAVHAE
jgi:hypothetical protein